MAVKIKFLGVRVHVRSLLPFLIVASLLPAASVHAARHKVDCRQVMVALNQGQKPKAVAKALGISASSVYRCRKMGQAGSKPAAPPSAGR